MTIPITFILHFLSVSSSFLSLSFSVRADKSELAVASFLPENYLSFEKQGVEIVSFIVLVSLYNCKVTFFSL